MRLLLVEDDPHLAEILREGLTEEGYAVDVAADGEEGLWRARTVDYDGIVLDIMLPRLDGLTLLRRIREEGRRTPVLLLTARDTVDDRVTGLDSGADDYLVKPFAVRELFARVRSLVRRGANRPETVYRFESLELDAVRRTVRVDGREVQVTPREFDVLHLMVREPERVFTGPEIEEHLYSDEREADSNVVQVFVSRLRKKLGGPDREWPIRTLRGAGYRLGGGHA